MVEVLRAVLHNIVYVLRTVAATDTNKGGYKYTGFKGVTGSRAGLIV